MNIKEKISILLFCKYVCCLLLMTNFFSCKDKSLKEKISEFEKKQIILPYNELERKICSMYADTTDTFKNDIIFVNYISKVGCTTCEISKIGRIESNLPDMYRSKIDLLYIINTDKEHYKWTYDAMCNARIEGKVYFDTCNSFIRVNPNFPNSNLFHSFIMNKSRNVLLVGNPFENDQLKKLLDQIIKKKSNNITQ